MENNPSKEMINLEFDDQMARNDNDSDNDNTGIGRTYECSYCKRGFTNAQALGGHMNIHRKDKAKNSKQPTFSSSSSISYKLPEETLPYSPTYVSQRNYQSYNYNYNNPLSNYNPRSISQQQPPSIYHHGSSEHLPMGRSSLFGMYNNEEHLDADLSLRISSSSSSRISHQEEVDQENKNKKKEKGYEAIDLELRLGYDP